MRRTFLAIVLAFAVASTASADSFNFSVAGVQSFDEFASSATTAASGPSSNALGGINETFVIEIGSNDTLDSIDFNVFLTPQGASWYSEADIAIGDVAGQELGSLEVSTDGFAGDQMPLQYVGSTAFGLTFTDSNGDGSNDIVIEFYESFDDVGGSADTVWSDGVGPAGGLTFNVSGAAIPEPTSAAVLAIAACGLIRRRR